MGDCPQVHVFAPPEGWDGTPLSEATCDEQCAKDALVVYHPEAKPVPEVPGEWFCPRCGEMSGLQGDA